MAALPASRLPFPAWLQWVVVILALVLLSLAALHPMLFGALPASVESRLHLYRLLGLEHALQNGSFWPRYASGMAFGYGLPLFTFTSPAPYYPLLGLRALGLSAADALLVGSILLTLFGLLGVYLLAACWGGPVMGLGAAAAYLYAPYTLLNWTYRTALPEIAGLALLAWTLWAFRRLAVRGRRLDFLLAAGFAALLFVTHNVTALVGLPLLLAYTGVLWWTSPDPRRAFYRLGAALLLAGGLSAFYWLPALAEARYVRLDLLPLRQGIPVYAANFQRIGDLLSLPSTADLTRLNQSDAHPLGWPQVLLALAGVVPAVFSRRRPSEVARQWRPWTFFALPSLGLLLFAALPLSAWFWAHLPFLSSFLYPWRLVGYASLLLAVLSGGGLAWLICLLRRPLWQAAAALLAVIVMVLYGLPWLYVPFLPDQPAASIVDVQNFERAGALTDAAGERAYLPRWTVLAPEIDRLTGLYAQSGVIPRLLPNPSVAIIRQNWDALEARVDLEASDSTLLVFYWLYFPGWRAWVDGEEVRVRPISPHGFASVKIEAGRHAVHVAFHPTPLRLAASIVSLAAAALAGAALFLHIWRAPASTSPADLPRPGPILLAVMAAGLLGFALKALLIDNLDSPFKRARFAQGIEAGVGTPLEAGFGDQVTLLGYDLPHGAVVSGRTLPLTLYWTVAEGMPPQNVSSLLVLRDPAGNIVSQFFSEHPAGVPAASWLPGFYVQEAASLPIPSGTPPGVYRLQVGVYAPSVSQNLPVNGSGAVLLDLAEVSVAAPRRPVRPAHLDLLLETDARLGDNLTLLGVGGLPAQASVGQPFTVAWGWQARSAPGEDFRARLVWLDVEGSPAANSRAAPLTPGFPTGEWSRRDVWRGLAQVYVPGRLESGRYEVAVELLAGDGRPLGDPVPVGEMLVAAPERSRELPSASPAPGAVWSNGILLAGYDLPQAAFAPGDGLRLALYWQTGTDVYDSLIVFVHLVDENGRIAARAEQVPAFGARPTTGWAPGEVIADLYGLLLPADLAPGTYRLRLGLLDPATGQRVPLADGAEFWQAPQMVTLFPR